MLDGDSREIKQKVTEKGDLLIARSWFPSRASLPFIRMSRMHVREAFIEVAA
jgi:hypothetical protein